MQEMQNKSFLTNLIKGVSKRATQLLHNPYKDLNISPFYLKYLKHLPPGEIKKHQMPDGEVQFINPQEFLHAVDELFIDEIYKLQLPDNAFIIDCGANIGMSVIYLKKKFRQAHIIAFEPDEKNFSLLKNNVAAFGFTKVDLRMEAVWIENTNLSFASEGSMSSKIDDKNFSSTQVKAIRLKELLNQHVDFLKIDIEGAEYEVLKDIKDQLHFVENIFVEYHGNFDQNNELVELFDIFQKAGFAFYIKEATSVYDHPFFDAKQGIKKHYDLQLNIFCFRKN